LDAVACPERQQLFLALRRIADHLTLAVEGDAQPLLARIGIGLGLFERRHRAANALIHAQPREVAREGKALRLRLALGADRRDPDAAERRVIPHRGAEILAI